MSASLRLMNRDETPGRLATGRTGRAVGRTRRLGDDRPWSTSGEASGGARGAAHPDEGQDQEPDPSRSRAMPMTIANSATLSAK